MIKITVHSIIVIKNENGEYLQYYDNIWNSLLFPNCKLEEGFSNQTIVEYITNNTYACSYTEVLEILKHIPKEQYDKIPKEKIEFYENNKDNEYICIFNESTDIDMISGKAKSILINLYKNYIADNQEKQKIEEKLRLNEIKHELEKAEKYNLNDLFKNKRK